MLLKVRDLSIGFKNRKNMHTVVDNVSFEIAKKEIVGIVGESGSGKTVTALSLMGLQGQEARIQKGSIVFDQQEMINTPASVLEKIRGSKVAMIFQEPMTSLNPLLKVGAQIEEMLILHTDDTKEERTKRVVEVLKEVELQDTLKVMNAYPHELSGGMRQRVMIAMAMILRPKLIIADEPTTALDVSVQAQILRLLLKLNKEYGISILLISHDIGVVKKLCSRIIVMEAGRIVETNDTEELLKRPKEEYTKKLLEAVPSITREPLYREHASKTDSIVKVEHLNVYYHNNGMIHEKEKIKIVKDVSFEVHPLEIVGVVGESGSGKSTLAKAVVGLNKNYEGVIECKERYPQMVFQDPYSSLNQAKKVAWILEEPLKIRGGYSKEARRKLIDDKLREVGLAIEIKDRKVNQLSGGQRQRICIAIALMQNSKFIVLDEAVSALDVTVQRQILKLLMNLKEKYELSFLFISHDMNVIHEMCNRVIVMYQGKIIEEGDTKEVFQNPKEEYTKKLIEAVM